MARKRTKVYKAGDRIQVSLNSNLSQTFLDWINKQSDLTNFFLYSASELYKKTGNIDVATIMPRVFDIEDFPDKPLSDEDIKTNHMTAIGEYNINNPTNEFPSQEKDTKNNDNEKTDVNWSSLNPDKFNNDIYS